VDVWDDTTASDSGLDESVELLISSDSKLEMSWSNSLHLKILGSVTSELKNLSGQVLEDSSAVNCGCGTDSAVGADSALQDSVNSSNWELFEFKNYGERMMMMKFNIKNKLCGRDPGRIEKESIDSYVYRSRSICRVRLYHHRSW
jgi:hypothetical protein